MADQPLYFDSLEEMDAHLAQSASGTSVEPLYFDSLEELDAYQSQALSKASANEQEEAGPGFLSNAMRGLGQRAARLPGIAASSVKTVGDAVAGGAGLDPLWAKYSKALDVLSTLKETDFGYEPRATWEGVKQAEGALDTAAAAGAFAVEQGVGSVPDMVASIYALPALVVARAGEIGDERAFNDGKDSAEALDIIKAAPAALASALLDRFGAQGITQAGANQISALALEAGAKAAAQRAAIATGKAATREAATEAAQEGVIEYLGATLGTDNALDFWESMDRAAAGAVAGGFIGGSGGAAVATGREIVDARSPDVQLARAMQSDINASQLASPAPIDSAVRADRPSILDLVNDRLINKGLPPLPASPAPAGSMAEPIKIRAPKRATATTGAVEVPQPVPFDYFASDDQAQGAQADEVAPVPVAPDEQRITQGGEDLPPSPMQMRDLAVVEAPIGELSLSNDVPQFKSGANKNGVVEPLGGSFDRTGVAPIQVWVRSNGKKEVISGRHRLDLARRSGETTIPAQYHFEKDGFNADQAATLDALLNIREGQGQVRDYVQFIGQSGLTKEEADAQGILARSTGQRAYSIATQGSDALVAAHASGELSDQAAAKIADAAPGNESLQAVGIKAIQDGKSIAIAENLVKALQTLKLPVPENMDLFGFDDSAMRQAAAMAGRAIKIQQSIQDQISAAKGAATRPESAKKLGVNVRNPQSVIEKIKSLEASKQAWSNWPTNKDFVEILANDENVEAYLSSNIKPAGGKKAQQKKKAKTKNNADKKTESFAFKPSDTFAATGNKYVPTYASSSLGMPPRYAVIELDGKAHKIPRVQRVEPIHAALVDIIGRRTYYRHIKGKDVLGYYKPGVGVLRTKKKNDVEVLAHEMAHYLDMYGQRQGLPPFSKLYTSSKHRAEVMALSYTDKNPSLQMSEGFAEFVRLWLTNNAAAIKQAPGFYAAFNLALKSEPVLNKKMKRLRELMHNYYYQGYIGRMEAGIGHYPDLMHRFDDWWYRRISRARQQALDSAEALKQVEIELTKKIGPAEASAWKMARIAKGGYREIAEHFLNYGTLNWKPGGAGMVVTGKSLREVFAPIKQVKLKPEHKALAKSKFDLLMQYFKAMRAIELHQRGRERQVDLGDARKMEALAADYPEFRSIFNDFQKFNDRMLDFYQSSGIISAQTRKAIKELNKSYVPFHRIREYLGGAKAPKGGIKRLVGGTANTEDILINIQDSIVENVRAAMSNRSKQLLYKTIQGSEDGAIFAAKIPPGSKKVSVATDEIVRKIKGALDLFGVDVETDLGFDVKDIFSAQFMQFWQHGMPPSVGDSGNVIDSVLDSDGKTSYFEVRDPLLMEHLQSLDPVSASAFVRLAHGVKNMFTRTVTLGLQFMGANFVMDTFSAAVYTKNARYIPVVHSVAGMYDFLRKNEHYTQFIRSGGGGSSLEAATRLGSSRRSVRVDEFGPMTIPDRILAAIDKLGTISEYGTRIAEFKLSKKSGKSDFEAAFDARQISTDYNVIGANHFLANFYRSIHFFNAALQSMDRMYLEFKTKRLGGNVLNLMVRGALGVMLPTIMLYLFNREDEAYNDEPVHKRLKNWYIPIGTYPNGRTKFFTLPRPYDVGHIFGSLPEILVEYMFTHGDSDRAVKDFWWVVGDMFSLDATPSIFMGLSDVVLNKDWKGAPVVPVQYQSVAPKDQFDAQTSETFYLLGQALNISPMKAEHMYSSSLGYLGGYLLYAMDDLLWDEKRFGEKAEPQLTGNAAANAAITRFVTPAVRSYIRDTSEFFEVKQKAEEVFKTFGANIDERRAITGRTADFDFKDDARGLTKEEKQVLFDLNKTLNDLTSQLYGREGLKTQELLIMYNKNLSASEKRKQIDSLWQTRNEALKSAFAPIRAQLAEAKKIAAKRKKAEKNDD